MQSGSRPEGVLRHGPPQPEEAGPVRGRVQPGHRSDRQSCQALEFSPGNGRPPTGGHRTQPQYIFNDKIRRSLRPSGEERGFNKGPINFYALVIRYFLYSSKPERER